MLLTFSRSVIHPWLLSVWSTEIARAVAAAAAATTTPHQLRFSTGQLIVVLAKNSTGWWLGELQVSRKSHRSAVMALYTLKYFYHVRMYVHIDTHSHMHVCTLLQTAAK